MKSPQPPKEELSKCCGAEIGLQPIVFSVRQKKVCSKCGAPFTPAEPKNIEENPFNESLRMTYENTIQEPKKDSWKEEDRLIEGPYETFRMYCTQPTSNNLLLRKVNELIKSLLAAQTERVWEEVKKMRISKKIDPFEHIAEVSFNKALDNVLALINQTDGK